MEQQSCSCINQKSQASGISVTDKISDSYFCCKDKKRLMKNNAFLDRITVEPELLAFTKHEKCKTYKKSFEIKNEDRNPVRIEVSSDFTDEIRFRINDSLLISPLLILTVDVYYEPTENSLRNRPNSRRHSIFISTQHPKVTMEVPILIFRGKPDLYIPRRVFFSKCNQRITSYYTMTIYNPHGKDIIFTSKWKSKNSNLQIISKTAAFSGKACTKVHFSLTPETFCSISDELMINWVNSHVLSFSNAVELYQPFISHDYIRFKMVYIGYSAEEHFNVCNEFYEPIKIKWCRREIKDPNSGKCDLSADVQNVKHLSENFILVPKCAIIQANSSLVIRATFIPTAKASFAEKTQSEFKAKLKANAFLAFSTNEQVRLPITLSGVGRGPEMVLSICYLELGSVIVGEKRRIRLKVTNPSIIPGIAKFIGSDGVFGGVASCCPEFNTLDPQEEKGFIIEYYGTQIGKFIEKILFNVENGGSPIHLTISGIMEPIKVITKPNSLDYGEVFICSLQKKDLTITNPLSCPIIIKLSTASDGNQEPLIISSFYDFISDADKEQSEADFKAVKSCLEDTESGNEVDINRTPSRLSLQPRDAVSMSDMARDKTRSSVSVKSSGFIDVVGDSSGIVGRSLRTIVDGNAQQNANPDLAVLGTVINEFLQVSYFKPLVVEKEKQKAKMNIPDNPRTFLYSTIPIEIEAFQSVTIPIFLAPNQSGKNINTLKLTVNVNHDQESGDDANKCQPKEMLELPVDAITTLIPTKYQCLIPELKIPENLFFEVGIDLPEIFDFKVANVANAPGIFTIKSDESEAAQVVFTPTQTVIEALQTVTFVIEITNRIIGDNSANARIEIFGKSTPIKFSVRFHSDPPKFKIHKTKITHEQTVLLPGMCATYISNIGTGLVQYTSKLKSGANINCLTCDGQLFRKECGEIGLSPCYRDAGIYNDVLSISVKHLDTIVTIPVTIKVVGIPLRFTPNLAAGLNLNRIATSKKNFVTTIKVHNLGELPYKLNFSHRRRSGIIKSQFEFEKPSIYLNPEKTTELKLILTRQDPIDLKQEYRLDVMQGPKFHMIPGLTFTIEAKLISTNLKWSKPMLEFEFRNSDFYDMSYGEHIALLNTSELTQKVSLEVDGSFQIYDPIKHLANTRFDFTMLPMTTRDLAVCFDVKEVNKWDRNVEYRGNIQIWTPEKSHKPLPLHSKIIFPVMTIPTPSVRYFSLTPFLAKFEIENPGELIAFYNWLHPLEVTRHHIRKLIHPLYKTISEELHSRNPVGFILNPINVTKEFLISFQKSLDFDSKHNNFYQRPEYEEEEEDDSESRSQSNISKIQETFKKKDSKNAKSKQEKEIPKSKTKKTKGVKDDGSVNDKSSIKGKGRKLQKSQSPEKIKEPEEPPMPEFVCKESKLQVKIEEIVNNLEKLELASEQTKTQNDSIEELYEFTKHSILKVSNQTKPSEYFYLDHYKGSVKPGARTDMYLYFSGDPEEVEIRSTLVMDVIGGKSEKMDITILNSRSFVEISETNFTLGIQPWYKVNHFKIMVRNTNSYPVQITPLIDEYRNEEKSLITGYLLVSPKDRMYLSPGFETGINVAVYLGLNYRFKNEFGLEVNGHMPTSIQFNGSGCVPMISILNLERLPFADLSTDQEYILLNKIFVKYIDNIVLKSQTVREIDILNFKNSMGLFDIEEENDLKEEHSAIESISSKSTESGACKTPPLVQVPEPEIPNLCCSKLFQSNKTEISVESYPLSSISNDTNELTNTITLNYPTIENIHLTTTNALKIVPVLNRLKYRAVVMQQADPDLQDYCVLDYPAEYPCELKIQHLLEMEQFLSDLHKKEVWKGLRQIIKKTTTNRIDSGKYPCGEKKYERPIRPIWFKIQPLPVYSTAYCFNFGTISTKRDQNWTFELFFHGPGKMFLSVRSLIAIPGMNITFLDPDFDCHSNSDDFKFTLYNNSLTPQNSKYKNINVRSHEEIESIQSNCGDCTGKNLCRTHSYDFNARLVHTREIDTRNRKTINEMYSCRSRPNKDCTDPFIHCEIFQEHISIPVNYIFKLNINFKPTAQYYDDPTVFEDYIYVDIHRGPTIPILLQGTISSTASEEEAEEQETDDDED